MLSDYAISAIAIVPAVAVSVELFMHLPIIIEVQKLRGATKKSISVIFSSRISDHWKEKSIKRYSQTMMISSCLLLLYLILLLGVFLSVYSLTVFFFFESFAQQILKLLQIKIQLATVFVGLLYGFLRKILLNG